MTAPPYAAPAAPAAPSAPATPSGELAGDADGEGCDEDGAAPPGSAAVPVPGGWGACGGKNEPYGCQSFIPACHTSVSRRMAPSPTRRANSVSLTGPTCRWSAT